MNKLMLARRRLIMALADSGAKEWIYKSPALMFEPITYLTPGATYQGFQIKGVDGLYANGEGGTLEKDEGMVLTRAKAKEVIDDTSVSYYIGGGFNIGRVVPPLGSITYLDLYGKKEIVVKVKSGKVVFGFTKNIGGVTLKKSGSNIYSSLPEGLRMQCNGAGTYVLRFDKKLDLSSPENNECFQIFSIGYGMEDKNDTGEAVVTEIYLR